MNTDLKCELSWSVSRAGEFDRCQREAWYARYACWRWWEERPRGERFEIMVHKNLSSLAMFTGTCVHEAIEDWFAHHRDSQTWNARQLFEAARERFRRGWLTSRDGSWQRRPNKSVHLEEHHYGQPIPRETSDRVRALIERCTAHFIQLESLGPVREAEPADWFPVESLDTFELEGVKIYAVPDFAHRSNGIIHIWDWKTGRPKDRDLFQLRTYALFALARWNASPDGIALHAVYLDAGRVVDVPFGPNVLVETREAIGASLEALRAAHYDPDSEPSDAARWPPSGAPRACPHCRFRGLCDAAAS